MSGTGYIPTDHQAGARATPTLLANVRIMEVVIYDQSLTPAERDQARSYLLGKYSLP
jgi:hypothetical protein